MSQFRNPLTHFSRPSALDEPKFRSLYQNLMEHVERHAYEYIPISGTPEFVKGWKDAHKFLLRKAVEGNHIEVKGYTALMFKKVEPETLTVAQAKELDII